MDAYIGEIRPFAGLWVPEQWASCDGRTLSIARNPALYSLIGTTYGGDGVNSFALPNLGGRLPIGRGQRPGAMNYALGAADGAARVSLTSSQMPSHTHRLQATTVPATDNVPGNDRLMASTVPDVHPYNDMTQAGTGDALFAPEAIAKAGSGEAHENMMPSLVITYIICLAGLFPDSP